MRRQHMSGLTQRELKCRLVRIGEVVDRTQSRPMKRCKRRRVPVGIEASGVDGVGGSACRWMPAEQGSQHRNVGKDRMLKAGAMRLAPAPLLHCSAVTRGEIIQRVLERVGGQPPAAFVSTPSRIVLEDVLRGAG